MKLSETKLNVIYKIDEGCLILLIESVSGETNEWIVTPHVLNVFTIGSVGDHVELDSDGNETEYDDWSEMRVQIDTPLDELHFVEKMYRDHILKGGV
jgi:hypothetical protein